MILAHIGYAPIRIRGDQARGACPLQCKSVGRSGKLTFSVHLGRGLYQCFRCRASGDQIDLWSALTGLPRPTAAANLREVFGIDPTPSLRNPEFQARQTTPPATTGQ